MTKWTKEYMAEYQRLYREKNREFVLLVQREGMRQKRANDPAYRARELNQQRLIYWKYRAKVAAE